MPHLVVLASSALFFSEGQVHLPAKFESGMSKYAELFPGDVHVLARPAKAPDVENLGGQFVSPRALNFGVHVSEDLQVGLRSLRADIALISLSDDHAALLGIASKTVFSAEHASRSWLAMSLAEPHSLVDRMRMELGYRRLERRLVRHVARADGVHCNGIVAWSTYGGHSRDALRVYDSRVSMQAVADAARAPRDARGEVLRLAFSGRLTAIKGPQHAVRLPEALADRGIRATLDVFGDGPMRADLENAAGPHVRFHGAIDFSEWLERIPKQVDLMVLPHVQPDPSGTYFESAGVGVPIVSFSNETVRDLSQHGFVMSTDQWSSDGLADVIAQLAGDQQWMDRASRAGQDFMRRHSFENDFEARIDHLQQVM